MEIVYYLLIKHGKRTIKQVPKELVKKVKELLEADEATE